MKLKRRPNLGFLLISLSVLIVLALLYLVARHVAVNEALGHAAGVAIATAAGIEPEDVASIRKPSDVALPAFQKVQRFLHRVSGSNLDVKYVYLIRKITDKQDGSASFEYVLDDSALDINGNGVLEAGEIRRLPGTPFEHTGGLAELKRAWYHPTSQFGDSPGDEFAGHISGFAPVKETDGETVAILGVDISSSDVRTRLFRLRVSVVAVWLFLSLLGFYFSGITKRKWLGYVLVSLIILVLFGFLYMIARRVIINEIRYHAMGVAIATAAGIEASDIEGISSAEDIARPGFQRLQKFLGRISDTNVDVRYIYIMRRSLQGTGKASDFEYVVDEVSMDENGNGVIDPQEVGNPPGTYYDASGFPQMVKAWYQATADYDVSPDPPYPDLMSGYAPIKNQQGRTVAIVGVDVTAAVVKQKLKAVQAVIVIVWAALSLMTIAVLQFYFSQRKLLEERNRLVEQLAESERKYRELSVTDDLTGLNNTRLFYEQLNREISRTTRYGHEMSLLLLDIDDFKAFNDTFGHLKGNKALTRLGEIIRANLRESDSGYRYGGEEFTVILPETSKDQGMNMAERIRRLFEEEGLGGENGRSCITVSIGVAEYKPGEDEESLVRRADEYMYQAKREGKNRVCCL